ncbi:hypothetical protein BC834DRAFT_1040589 [Gloeopeniophorella convolvens]|nr:hypothetical protein BC834DRAFT_1040589 [Gloeopeniophorella convolvens]
MGSPTLPPEIWLHIFEIAADTPGAFDPDVPEYFSHPTAELFHVDNTSELTMLRASLVIRRVLVRVCHMWNALATPLLYRALWIGRQGAILLLVNTLGRRPELGTHARRLDVAICKGPLRHRPSAQEPLAHILTYTPHLEVFVASISGQPSHISYWKSPEIYEALRDVCGPSLRRLCWVGAHINGGEYRWVQERRAEVVSLLQHTPNLRTLIGLLIPMGPDLPLALPQLAFGHFEVLSLLAMHPTGLPACFPSLQHAQFLCYDPWEAQQRGPLSAIVPPPLFTFTTAYLAHSGVLFALTGTPITKLHLSSLEWGGYENAYPPRLLPATIVYLGISTRASRTNSGPHFVTFVKWLHACKDAAPSLSVVRLSNDMGSASLVKHPEWLGDGIVQLGERGVRIENAEGGLLQPDRPAEWDFEDDDSWVTM